MTLRKKLWITVACLSVILCTLVTGTIAWLTDKTNPITNTFTPSNIGITLTESKALDLQMVPGKTITKDPKVTVAANSEACYVFLKVEKSANLDQYIACAIASGWSQLKDAQNNDVPGVYYREVTAVDAKNGVTYDVLGAGDVTINDFQYSWAANKVLVRPDVTKSMMQDLNKSDATQPTLTFTAYACQAEGFSTPAAAWAEAQKAPATT